MICFPNAKINLGLNVLSRRKDGYHNISSLLYPVPLCDVLEFFPSDSFTLRLYGTDTGIPEKKNLVTKAWALMHRQYGIPPLRIKLLKNIPAGAGLGGGSADAAFLLKAVNECFDLKLSVNKLENLSSKIGSDCPFFIRNTPAMVGGRGERVDPLSFSLKDKYLVLVLPDIRWPTEAAYARIASATAGQNITEIINQPIETWKNALMNDFEKIFLASHPQLKNIRQSLYNHGALYASLTGSGSGFYGIFNQRPELTEKGLGHRVVRLGRLGV